MVELRGRLVLERRTFSALLPMATELVAKQQVIQLGEAARPAHLNVRARLARRLAEVPFGALDVVHTVKETEALQRFPKRVGRLQRATEI